jgi:Uma2 family endonuclease
MVTLQLRQISIPQGQRILFNDLPWLEFEAILEELGDKRTTRLAYYQRTLEIRIPSPEHERAKVITGDLLKILLDELNLNWEPFGSTTFKRQEMAAGIEPDDCFYIQNYATMIGKKRVDLIVDPPPDLAIEVDITSKTRTRVRRRTAYREMSVQLSAYEALGVPEIWRYENQTLKIYLLQDHQYVESPTSPTFPNFPIIEGISQFLEMSLAEGTSVALRAFRQWVRNSLMSNNIG